MTLFERIEYTGKALVGGAGLGLAICGLLSLLSVTISLAVATTVASTSAVLLSAYTFTHIE